MGILRTDTTHIAARAFGAAAVPVRSGVEGYVGAWLLVFAMALFVPGTAAGTSVTDLQTLTEAKFARSDSPRPPENSGEALTLPDPWELRHPGESGHAWYFVDWRVASAPTDLQAIYLTAVTLPAQVFVNDASVGLTGSLDGRRPRSWEQSQLFEVPAALLHAGANRIAVRVNAPRAGGGLGPIVVGAHAAARDLQMRDLMAHTIGPAIVSVIMVVVGLTILALWLRRRDASYQLFGLAAVVWGLHTAATLLPEPLLPQPHWAIWWHATYMAFVVLLCVFCIRFAGENWPAYRRFAMIFAIVVAPLLYVASAAGALGPATVYVRLVGIALVAVALAAVARYALRLRNTESLLLAATGLIAIVFAIHDWMADQDPLAIRPLWLVPYSAFAFLVLFSWILIDRFVRALDEYERLNADLEQRIAAKSASLEFQLMQTEQARQEAESANRAKSRFLAAASHDLRQPLHALGLFADALPGHTRDDEGRELVHRIGTSVASLDALLSALLDISKLDAGVIAVERKDMRLNELFDRIANDFAPEALEKGLRLAVVATSAVVYSDPALLERIVRNLVANALRYTESGSVVVGARRRGGRIAVEVWDSGIGIAPGEREQIFEEFYQIGNPERDRTRGLGLGLAIVRRLSVLMGHDVEVSSRVGRGSVFRVLLDAGNENALGSGEAIARPPPGSMQGCCVVVVDDEPSVRESTRYLLASWGCTVVAASDPVEAITALEGRTPAALLVDYRLRGGQDGLGAIVRLRAALGHAVPAVLVSGESSADELALIKASGFPLLHKPVPPARLRAAVVYMLQASRRGPSDGAQGPRANPDP